MKRPGGFDDAASERKEPQQGSERSPRKRSWFGLGSDEAEVAADHRAGRAEPVAAQSESVGTRPEPLSAPVPQAESPVVPVAHFEPAAVRAEPDTEPHAEPLLEPQPAESGGVLDAEDMTATAAVLPLRRVSKLSKITERQDLEADPVRAAEARLKQAGRDRRSREQRERRRFTEHLRVRRRRVFIALGTVLALALFVIAGVFTPIMAVRDVQLRGAQGVNVEELQQSLSRFQGVPLALVSDQDVHRAIEAFPLVQRYSIERIPPHTLIVTIEERVAAVALEREGGFDLLDPAGVLLGRVPERPVGVPLGSAELTDTSSPAFAAATGVVRDMPDDIRALLSEVRASNAQNVTFTLSDGTEVLWGESKETQRKSVVLRSLLASIGPVSMIDLSAPDAPVFK